MCNSYYILNSIYEFLEGTNKNMHRVEENIYTLNIESEDFVRCDSLFENIFNLKEVDECKLDFYIFKDVYKQYVVIDVDAYSHIHGKGHCSKSFAIDKLRRLIKECLSEDDYTIQQELIEDLNASRLI